MEIKKPVAVGLMAASIACRHPHIEVPGLCRRQNLRALSFWCPLPQPT